MNSVDSFERAYSTKEIADTLSIGDSTLRKWSIALEKNGYSFSKNDQGYRLYLERDIMILRQFKTLVKEANMPLETAGKVIADRHKAQSFAMGTGVALQTENVENTRSDSVPTEQIQEIVERLEKQEEFNMQLVDMLKKQNDMILEQQKYISEKLDKRDQQLMEAIRESQETKKLILEQTEHVAAAHEKEPKRGLFKWFFK